MNKSASGSADEALYDMPPVQKHQIKSNITGQDYQIFVQLPPVKMGEDEKFPVFYWTDMHSKMDTTLIELMQVAGELPRFITVGIGYPVEHVLGGNNLRMLDFTPTETDYVSSSVYIKNIVPIEGEKKSGGAPEFLQFIREELMPFINSQYPTTPSKTTYSGHSFGGLFGLYMLFHAPDTFENYMIGSPSIWWDDNLPLKWAQDHIDAKKPLKANVYLSAGGKEDIRAGHQHGMTSNVYKLESMLVNAEVPDLILKTEIFPEEEHISVIYMILSRGLRYVYGRGCPLFD